MSIIYRLPISLQEIEIYRLSVSPRAFLKLSIIVIAIVQKGLSCPSLAAIGNTKYRTVDLPVDLVKTIQIFPLVFRESDRTCNRVL